jgi:FtsP/CotA-like multicopper oxidase with cupredoxin domain
MNRVDFAAKVGTVERWVVVTQMMGHPFHAHGVRFLVDREKGAPPPLSSSGWKDTIFVEEDVELLVEINHPADAANAYMLHCHILEHEDSGMMAQFTVA